MDDTDLVTTACAGDDAAFAALAGRYRRQLHVHCYRMLGSLEEAEDAVQETLLRAWRGRAGFSVDGRWSYRAWLYRIATNVCLTALARTPRRVLPSQIAPARGPSAAVLPAAELPWLQPYPDALLDELPSGEAGPDAVVLARETIELAFLAAIQLLPPRQRAALILRDVLDWSAKDTAALLDVSVAAANSALQRARAALRRELPAHRTAWSPAAAPSSEERVVLRRYMEAHERADVDAIARLLREDARGMMPPSPTWFDGREAIVSALARSFDPASSLYVGALRFVPTRANSQPAAACYARRRGADGYAALSLDVLCVQDGLIAEIVGFGPELFPRFGLPVTL
ncbi:RNA polymerase subunit sigma-70 [Conexibacter woesei]|uniref:RNA polymerase, sigma-24 subunit, ECF subfamily n=1 Tax=Conexibacter woesei (strain DSM 14684 / CCUG 47730 / CIP 108061 / JCM 11494 / NBRC 100937 / ID131577) TaxID=469383 RepID=D3F7M3_CONWI|nr:RNA polymerase subunit sigma-70 [Conexibacter woesei]ADB50885.1 RNA polymerase, sigma-24 subunit, ECF subfamily [Conexibacter woesei DSM 14684]